MQNRISWPLAVISVIVLFASCIKANIETGNQKGVALHSCNQQAIDPYICFDSLITDSRCPIGVECVWQGTAIIGITFSEAGNSHHLIMSLKGFPSLGYPSDTTINGYRIIFTDLKPYPDTPDSGAPEPRAFFSISQ